MFLFVLESKKFWETGIKKFLRLKFWSLVSGKNYENKVVDFRKVV